MEGTKVYSGVALYFQLMWEINQKLVREALDEWDRESKGGCFVEYIRQRTGEKWQELLRSN